MTEARFSARFLRGDGDFLPFREFLLKVASDCNLNCSYCYVYNQGDDTWRKQPKLMDLSVASQAAIRIREHAEEHSLSSVSLILHGGEPLLGGLRHLGPLVELLFTEFRNSPVKLQVGIQTNGTLLTPQIADFLLERSIKLSISSDGPPEYHNQHRVDRAGRGSAAAVERAIGLMSAEPYQAIFSGLLYVVNLEHNPQKVIEYLCSWSPRMIDILLPLDNHDRRPAGKVDLLSSPYGDWLGEAFDFWISNASHPPIRYFASMVAGLLGAPSIVESIGLNISTTIVVETDGSIEALDALKTSFNGGSVLGYSIFEDPFNTVASDPRVQMRQRGVEVLAAACHSCPILHTCGGGYLPHRFSSQNGYANPSVYCSDIKKIVTQIENKLFLDLSNQESRP